MTDFVLICDYEGREGGERREGGSNNTWTGSSIIRDIEEQYAHTLLQTEDGVDFITSTSSLPVLAGDGD